MSHKLCQRLDTILARMKATAISRLLNDFERIIKITLVNTSGINKSRVGLKMIDANLMEWIELHTGPETGIMRRRLGTLIRVKGDSYMVNLINGDRRPLHVDETTLLEAGLERGDRLIAKIRPDGHAISIIKDRGRLGEHFVTPEVPEGGYDYPDQRERYGKNYQYDNGNRYRN